MTQYSLTEFNLLVKKTLADGLEPSYWIVAEIGELNINRNGHCYMELVEKEGNFIKSKMRATIWANAFAMISRAFETQAGSPLKQGMKVLVNATLDYHEIYGLSLNIKDIDPTFTLGEREKARQRTLHQLEEDGIIDLNKSLTTPKVPQRIAVISSESAAGYGDFINQLNHNPYGYRILCRLFNATMQGDNAPGSIINSLHQIHQLENHFDLVVLIRGGGAKTDLDCFDDYELCAHLAQFPLPIITGIGHERDSTISDLVACVNLKTPTAVAEFLLSAFLHFENDINLEFENIKEHAQQSIAMANEKIYYISSGIHAQSDRRIQKERLQVEHLERIFKNRPVEKIRREAFNLNLLHQLIMVQDPNRILGKGFTLTKVNGVYLTKDSQAKTGDILETISTGRTIKSKVE